MTQAISRAAAQRQKLRKDRSRLNNRIADAITAFSGSMTFVVLHAIWFAIWIIANLTMSHPFDKFPFGLLTMIVSLEAIFLSTFVLISQNRQADSQEVRERIEFETDVQSDVWSEMIAEKLGVSKADVEKRVRQRLDDARRQDESDEKPSQASAPLS